MLSRFQQNKLLQLFAKLDRTGDGFIEYVDFIACYEVLRVATGWEPDHPDANRLLRTSREFWDQLCGTIDLNGDGRISSQEWVTFFNGLHDRVRGQDELPEWFSLTAGKFYGWLDLDGNGQVTREEYLFYLTAIGAEAADGAFEALAGEGGLTEESLLRAFRELLFNQNPDDPANYILMGKFPYVRPAEVERRA